MLMIHCQWTKGIKALKGPKSAYEDLSYVLLVVRILYSIMYNSVAKQM